MRQNPKKTHDMLFGAEAGTIRCLFSSLITFSQSDLITLVLIHDLHEMDWSKIKFSRICRRSECLFHVSHGTEHSHISASLCSRYLVFCTTISQYEFFKIEWLKPNSSVNPLQRKSAM